MNIRPCDFQFIYATEVAILNMEFSAEKRSNIVLLKELGHSYRQIAARLDVSIGGVQRTIARHGSTGSHTSIKRPGRPRKTSQRTDHMIRRAAVAVPSASSAFIHSQLPPEVGISTDTVRRRLRKDFGLFAYRPARKPKLSAKNVRDRMAFCKAHATWTVQQWEQVMFSDECTIRQFAPHTPYVRRPAKQRFNPRFVLPTVKHSPSVMVWGSISARGRAGISILPVNEMVNAVKYLAILQEKLPLWMPRHNCNTFQHDGAPCHQARLVKTWFTQQNFEVLAPWPGSSPDLNPIENCWTHVKRQVSNMSPTSLPDLRSKILQVWVNHITPEYCQELIHSMPRRIAAVLANKGGHSKY